MKAFISIDIGNQIVNFSSSAVIMSNSAREGKVFSREQLPLFRRNKHKKDNLLIKFILPRESQRFCSHKNKIAIRNLISMLYRSKNKIVKVDSRKFIYSLTYFIVLLPRNKV